MYERNRDFFFRSQNSMQSSRTRPAERRWSEKERKRAREEKSEMIPEFAFEKSVTSLIPPFGDGKRAHFFHFFPTSDRKTTLHCAKHRNSRLILVNRLLETESKRDSDRKADRQEKREYGILRKSEKKYSERTGIEKLQIVFQREQTAVLEDFFPSHSVIIRETYDVKISLNIPFSALISLV